MQDLEWLTLQRNLAREELQRASQEVLQRAPGAAMRFVGERPGLSMAIAAGAGFATAFAAVRALSGPDHDERPPEPARAPRNPAGWLHSTTAALRAFVSTAALVKAMGNELASAQERPTRDLPI